MVLGPLQHWRSCVPTEIQALSPSSRRTDLAAFDSHVSPPSATCPDPAAANLGGRVPHPPLAGSGGSRRRQHLLHFSTYLHRSLLAAPALPGIPVPIPLAITTTTDERERERAQFFLLLVTRPPGHKAMVGFKL